MFCGLPLVQQTAISNGLLFDPFPFDQNGLASPEVDVGGGQVADALMVARSTSVWSPDLPSTLCNGIGHREKLVAMLGEQQVVIADMRSAHVPVKVFWS
jgi:hypothetical protein